MATILLPKNTLELLKLAENIISKYETTNEINKFNNVIIDDNIENLKKIIIGIRPKHDEMIQHKNTADRINHEIQLLCGTHNSNRKISSGTIKFIVAQLRDILKGIHRENPTALTEWGFVLIEKKLK